MNESSLAQVEVLVHLPTSQFWTLLFDRWVTPLGTNKKWLMHSNLQENALLVGGFNQFEKICVKIIQISPGFQDEH